MESNPCPGCSSTKPFRDPVRPLARSMRPVSILSSLSLSLLLFRSRPDQRKGCLCVNSARSKHRRPTELLSEAVSTGNYPRALGWPSAFAACGPPIAGTVLSLLRPAFRRPLPPNDSVPVNMDDNGTILSWLADLGALLGRKVAGTLLQPLTSLLHPLGDKHPHRTIPWFSTLHFRFTDRSTASRILSTPF